MADRLTSRGLQRIASMTKPVTAVGTLSLIEEGRLSLDEPAAPAPRGAPTRPGT